MGRHFGQKLHLVAIPINVYIMYAIQSNGISTFIDTKKCL